MDDSGDPLDEWGTKKTTSSMRLSTTHGPDRRSSGTLRRRTRFRFVKRESAQISRRSDTKLAVREFQSSLPSELLRILNREGRRGTCPSKWSANGRIGTMGIFL